ncbi:MAG: thiamine pyrophosphate-dependent dehydrogenase E1 component subunit alpha [Myxococcota bacterium]
MVSSQAGKPREEQALEAYRRLYLIRRAEETIQAHYAEDEMKTPVHLSIGQEAIPVGVCAALEARDRIFATYRSHAVYLARTLDTDGFFAELYGRATGAGGGKAGSMHLAAPEHGLIATSAVVGTTIPLALGSALAAQHLGTGARVAVFFGDGAVDEGVFWESLNFACLRRLPVLFVCEDNGLAIHSPARTRHGYESLARVVSSFRCQVRESDTADALEIAELTREVLHVQAETGQPTLLHLHCYRFVEHVGPAEDRSFELAYRDREEFEAWKRRDPLTVLRARLCSEGIDEATLSQLEQQVEAQLRASRERARQAPFPPPPALCEDVYS